MSSKPRIRPTYAVTALAFAIAGVTAVGAQVVAAQSAPPLSPAQARTPAAAAVVSAGPQARVAGKDVRSDGRTDPSRKGDRTNGRHGPHHGRAGSAKGHGKGNRAGRHGKSTHSHSRVKEFPTGKVPSFVPKKYRATIAKEARQHKLPASLIAAQLQTESHFDPHAQSGAGAKGIAQFTDATAQAYGLKNPWNAKESIQAEAKMMRHLIGEFGSIDLALAAYNAGPGAVQSAGGIPDITETENYVSQIRSIMASSTGGGHHHGHGHRSDRHRSSHARHRRHGRHKGGRRGRSHRGHGHRHEASHRGHRHHRHS